MGRPGVKGPDAYSERLCLRRVRMSACGAYDSNGTYFGRGAPIYWYASDDGEIDGTLRASSRASAREQVLAKYPKARVRR